MLLSRGLTVFLFLMSGSRSAPPAIEGAGGKACLRGPQRCQHQQQPRQRQQGGAATNVSKSHAGSGSLPTAGIQGGLELAEVDPQVVGVEELMAADKREFGSSRLGACFPHATGPAAESSRAQTLAK